MRVILTLILSAVAWGTLVMGMHLYHYFAHREVVQTQHEAAIAAMKRYTQNATGDRAIDADDGN